MKQLKTSIFLLLVLVLIMAFPGMAVEYNEAPEFKEQVDRGELPPIAERLPDEPLVVGPGVLIEEANLDWEPGKYGGTLNSVHIAPDWNTTLFLMINEPLLGAPGISTNGIRGNVLKSYTSNEDNTEFTFEMREGLKWSDGQPVTSEDIRFTYEDVILNEEITPTMPVIFKDPAGNAMELEIIDDYSFKIGFQEPYGSFLTQITITGWAGYTTLLKPAHYLKDFHVKYTPIEEMEQELEENELEDEWWELFEIKDVTNWELTRQDAIGFPTLYPWERVEAPSGLIEFKRNPYFFKVDEQGNQLPYIDKVKSREVSNADMVTMNIISGEVDFLIGDVSLTDMPLFKQSEEKGGFRVPMLETHYAKTIFVLNPTFEDEVFQKLVNNKDFRRAINMAIDREEIINSVYYGFASSPDTIPADYDVEQANQILDDLGMTGRDDKGYRQGPDGEKLDILLEVAEMRPDFVPTAEIIVEQLREDLELNISMKQISRTLYAQRAASNELMATIFFKHTPLWRFGSQIDYLPDGAWGEAWSIWYDTDGKEGVEPPENIKDLYQIHEEMLAIIPDSPSGKETVDELYSWYNENIPYFITAEEIGYPIIVSENLQNVPHSGIAVGACYSGEQFFYSE